MKNILFFDTESTGVPADYNAPASDSHNWPRLVQFGYILSDFNRNVIDSGAFLVKPDGFVINSEATLVHGISTEKALNEGRTIEEALDLIQQLLEKADFLVGHNVDFDIKIVDAEFYRYRGFTPMRNITSICTMKSSTEWCDLPNHKWPKLVELHKKLFNQEFDNAHDALADINATYRCFWKLLDLGVIPPLKIDTSKFSILSNQDILPKTFACVHFMNKLHSIDNDSTIEQQLDYLYDERFNSNLYKDKPLLCSYQKDFFVKILSDIVDANPDCFKSYDKNDEAWYLKVLTESVVLYFVLPRRNDDGKLNKFGISVQSEYLLICNDYEDYVREYIVNNDIFSLTDNSKECYCLYAKIMKDFLNWLSSTSNQEFLKDNFDFLNRNMQNIKKVRQQGLKDVEYNNLINRVIIAYYTAKLSIITQIHAAELGLVNINAILSELNNIPVQLELSESYKSKLDRITRSYQSLLPQKTGGCLGFLILMIVLGGGVLFSLFMSISHFI